MDVQLIKNADQTYDVRKDGVLLGTVLKGWKATGGEGWLIVGKVMGNLSKVFPSRKAAVAALVKAS